MKISLCIDLLYLEITSTGPIFSDTNKLLAGMELAKKTGYNAVEFWDWDTRDYQALLNKKQELGLSVTAICAKNRGTLVDAKTHDHAIEGLKETIAVAKAFECPNIIITAEANAAYSRPQSHDNIVRALKLMAPLAEAAGVTLILEPITGSYFIDSKEPFEILDEVGTAHVKLLYDIFHYQNMEGNIVTTIRQNLDKIGHIHTASIPDRTEIFDGELNYSYIIKAIEAAGFAGYFGIEYRPTMDKEVSIQKTRVYIEAALQNN